MNPRSSTKAKDLIWIDGINLNIKILGIKGEPLKIKIRRLKSGGEAFKVNSSAFRVNDDVSILDPTVSLLVEQGKFRPVDLIVGGKLVETFTTKDFEATVTTVGTKR
ncbi:MAG: hypothetical protein M5U34_10715 [Chloroflexi bacterium]|nr:hypothetical protein [Chloroflexota bacterium]